MLQYDFTKTRFFHATSRDELPGSAELYVVTVALLLFHDRAYTSLIELEVVFDEDDLNGVAECIEYRLPAFAPDVGEGTALRRRLRDFIGLRVGIPATVVPRRSSAPT